VLLPVQEAIDWLAHRGYDPEMGARPLRRVIQQQVEDRLSDMLLSGEFEDGDTIEVLLGEDQILLKRKDGANSKSAEKGSEQSAEEMAAA
jgi:ATP-dependent Clp protease ATP-binding subunit ClpA